MSGGSTRPIQVRFDVLYCSSPHLSPIRATNSGFYRYQGSARYSTCWLVSIDTRRPLCPVGKEGGHPASRQGASPRPSALAGARPPAPRWGRGASPLVHWLQPDGSTDPGGSRPPCRSVRPPAPSGEGGWPPPEFTGRRLERPPWAPATGGSAHPPGLSRMDRPDRSTLAPCRSGTAARSPPGLRAGCCPRFEFG